MADIVGVHGIWCDQQTEPRISRSWTERVRVGLSENHHPDPDSVTVALAYYGHLFTDGKGVEAVSDDVELDEFEQELLTAMAARAGVLAPGADSKFGLPGPVVGLLSGLANMPYFGTVSTAGVLWLVRQLRRYFGDSGFRAAVHAEIEFAMAEDTKVVIGHSLGSVAAYEALRAHPEWPARTLITLGSPLGLPGLRRRLSPPLTPDTRWPGSVTTWVNVAANEDPVALVRKLGPIYDERIRDLPARNTIIRGHDVTQYLRTYHTARALLDALG